MTLSHSGTASASLGRRLTTGPKNPTPPGGWKWMIGVPTSLPVSARASSASRRSSASNEVSSSASASSAGRPGLDRMCSRKVRTPPGSSPRGCHLGRNAARGHDRPRPLHPVTSRAAPPNAALPSTRVRQSERRRPRPPNTGPPRLNVPPGAGLVMRGGKQRGAWLDSWSSRCLRLGAGDGFGDGTGVSVFPAAALDDALDPPAVRRAGACGSCKSRAAGRTRRSPTP
jgi:hypothetical protein